MSSVSLKAAPPAAVLLPPSAKECRKRGRVASPEPTLPAETAARDPRVKIFDWDDTLLASSAKKARHYSFQKWAQLDGQTHRLLSCALRDGPTFIVTSSRTKTVSKSSRRLPRTRPLLKKLPPTASYASVATARAGLRRVLRANFATTQRQIIVVSAKDWFRAAGAANKLACKEAAMRAINHVCKEHMGVFTVFNAGNGKTEFAAAARIFSSAQLTRARLHHRPGFRELVGEVEWLTTQLQAPAIASMVAGLGP